MRARVAFALTVCGLCLVWPTSSLASVTVGSDLSGAADSTIDCFSGGDPCTMTDSILPGRPLSAPFSGVVVRWRISGKANPGHTAVALRVVRRDPVNSGPGVGAGTSPGTIGTTVAVYTNDARLPIRAGDNIGMDGDYGNLMVLHTNASAQIEEWTSPKLAEGGSPRVQTTGHNGWELLLNADIAAPPSSAVTGTTACPGAIAFSVAADPDPATGPKALHYRLDGGPETVQTASAGHAVVSVPSGIHGVEYWGEDLLGQQEAVHHSAVVSAGCPVVVSPSLSSVRLSAVTFRAASRGASLTRKRRPPVGTTVSYRDSQVATTTFTVLEPTTGHKKGRRCLAGRPRRGQKRCTRYVSVGSFAHIDRAGANRVRFTGRVRGRKLKSGAYRLTLTPKADGKTGRTITLAFRIVK
jgi:hypothetical protein